MAYKDVIFLDDDSFLRSLEDSTVNPQEYWANLSQWWEVQIEDYRGKFRTIALYDNYGEAVEGLEDRRTRYGDEGWRLVKVELA